MQVFHPVMIGRIARIALLAILVQALTPLWAGVIGTEAKQFVEICSVAGLKLVQVDGGRHQKTPSSKSACDHCPLCGGTGVAPPTGSHDLACSKPAVRYLGFANIALARPPSYPGHQFLSQAPPLALS
ncbi:hypothetical protein GALL_225110 [mine drainage metagenome]|uniref:DUF2946 domain-containing protein n=1 Tax=mine drainage metagenome TaxID=410659 RepID=A0A1J5RHH9_9ZZZZ